MINYWYTTKLSKVCHLDTSTELNVLEYIDTNKWLSYLTITIHSQPNWARYVDVETRYWHNNFFLPPPPPPPPPKKKKKLDDWVLPVLYKLFTAKLSQVCCLDACNELLEFSHVEWALGFGFSRSSPRKEKKRWSTSIPIKSFTSGVQARSGIPDHNSSNKLISENMKRDC